MIYFTDLNDVQKFIFLDDVKEIQFIDGQILIVYISPEIPVISSYIDAETETAIKNQLLSMMYDGEEETGG